MNSFDKQIEEHLKRVESGEWPDLDNKKIECGCPVVNELVSSPDYMKAFGHLEINNR